MGIIKTFDERADHIKQKSGTDPVPLACSNESLAGAVSQRACVYSGARVVLNPITDALHLVHGPIGCASYTWDIRGSSTSGPTLYKKSFSTDMKVADVIFGGEKKLAGAIRELAARYRPPAAFVYSTCIVGVIGDDLKAVCKSASYDLGIPVIPVMSEGFRGNKNEGYKAACNALFELLGTRDYVPKSPYAINLLGEYNVAGDLWNVLPLFEEMGVEVIASFTGDSRVEEIQRAHKAKLNLVQCSGSMTYLAKKMEEKYGISYRRVSFFGIGDISSALRTTAEFFEDPGMMERAEEIIARETARIAPEIERHKSRVAGKKAAIYMGGAAKAVSLVRAFGEIGMDVVIIGTQTGSRDDYKKISYIVKEGTVIIDDANPLELKELLVKQGADLLVAGVKERFLAYKLGVAFCDFNHDRTTTFEGFDGIVNFAREVDITINSPVWNLPVERVGGALMRSEVETEIGVDQTEIRTEIGTEMRREVSGVIDAGGETVV
ncbi:nitrogenase iron-molybdenum cofactor biosynthesis protein NifE [Methanotrichaceae archaeon M04Ac]|uniref:Nitrogenase iron-molybdenum cofactor biosynthesis protein NifE n=1 Tax=Candidatus Methanocrinis alkalitolerans TaxID=3033395 RepID=A0ABT5XES7_9EURY|nr:nitrogenase iron-molybdenum cofactor biosynthesis protein NifE [Candidatus Methanocrinis alkalitolerans]MCR3883337.1 nitrogenase iron-molybdenum cofactor biosynthesis protein NifE [Methanothrix sp.]MDF0593221.1 nitrogenase iron-molybdenum cofactor biosynthesis protein NifE [Candidatus Methanocrinis alkalitolerans]